MVEIIIVCLVGILIALTFSELFMEAMVKAAVIFIENLDEEGVARKRAFSVLHYVFYYLPETEDNFKFMFKVMKSKELQ